MSLFEKVKSKLKITFKKSSTSTLPVIRSEIIYKNESKNAPDYDYDILSKSSYESDVGRLHCRHKKRSKRTITARSPSKPTIQELYNRDFSWIDKNFEQGFGDSRHEVGYDKDEQRIDLDSGDMKYSRNDSLKDQDETDIESMFDFDEKPSVKKVSQTEFVRSSEPQPSAPPPDHNRNYKKYPYKKVIIPKKNISTLLADDDDENKPKKFYYYKRPSVEKLYDLDLRRTLAGKVSQYIDDRTLKEMLTIPREYFTENREKTRSRNISFGFNFQCKKRKFLRGRKYKMRMRGYEEGVNRDGGEFNDELAYKNSTTYFPIQRSGISWHKIPISKKELENLPNHNEYESLGEEIDEDEDEKHFSRPFQHTRRFPYQNKGILKNASPSTYHWPGKAQTSQYLNKKLSHFQKRNLDVKYTSGTTYQYPLHLTTQQKIDDLKKSEIHEKFSSDSKNLGSLQLDDILNRHLSTESKKIIHVLQSTSTQEFVKEQNVQIDEDNQSMGDGITLEKQRSSKSKPKRTFSS